MKEVLEALKTLQLSQAQLASNVDAISGRVNVLAGMKEVRDVAGAESSTAPRKEVDSISSIEESQEIKIPESPSLPATQVDSQISHARTPSSGTSRIILT